MTKFNVGVMLFYAVFLLFILNHYEGKFEKQNETIEIMQMNDKEMLKLNDILVKNDEKFLKTFCELHLCNKSEENLISKNIY